MPNENEAIDPAAVAAAADATANAAEALTSEFDPSSIDLARASSCLRIQFHQWGVRKRLHDSQFEVEANKEYVKANKALIKTDAYSKIAVAAQWIRNEMQAIALPCNILGSGHYLIANGTVMRAEERLQEGKRRWFSAVDEFMPLYPALREIASLSRAEGGLGELYDLTDYPSADEVRAKFDMSWMFYALTAPENLRNLSADLFQREQDKAKAAWASSIDEIRNSLRGVALGLVRGLRSKLAPDEEGNQRRVNSRSVKALGEFLDTINERNITNDTELQGLTDQLRTMLGTMPEMRVLRDDDSLRGRVASEFAAIEARLDSLVHTDSSGAREVSFEDEAEPASSDGYEDF